MTGQERATDPGRVRHLLAAAGLPVEADLVARVTAEYDTLREKADALGAVDLADCAPITVVELTSPFPQGSRR